MLWYLTLFAEVLADPENNFTFSCGEIGTKKSANNEIFDIWAYQNTFEMEMDNKIFKQWCWPIKRQCYKIRIHKLWQEYKRFSFFHS